MDLWIGHHLARQRGEQLVGQAAQRLQGLPEVAYAQPNFAVGINPPPDPMIRKPL